MKVNTERVLRYVHADEDDGRTLSQFPALLRFFATQDRLFYLHPPTCCIPNPDAFIPVARRLASQAVVQSVVHFRFPSSI